MILTKDEYEAVLGLVRKLAACSGDEVVGEDSAVARELLDRLPEPGKRREKSLKRPEDECPACSAAGVPHLVQPNLFKCCVGEHLCIRLALQRECDVVYQCQVWKQVVKLKHKANFLAPESCKVAYG